MICIQLPSFQLPAAETGWPLIIAAVIAASGVIFTQWSIHRADAKKHLRELEKEERQRKMKLRHDLYIAVLASFQEGISVIQTLPVATREQVAELRFSEESRKAIAAKDLIASTDVLQTCRAANELIALTVLELFDEKTQELRLSGEMDDLLVAMEGETSKFDSLIAEAEEIFKTKIEDLAILDPIRRKMDDVNEQSRFFRDQHSEKLKLRDEQYKRMRQIQFERLPEILNACASATLAIRLELGHETDDQQRYLILHPTSGAVIQKAEAVTKKAWGEKNGVE